MSNETIFYLTALHLAALDKDSEKIERLLSLGANVDIRDESNWTPLHQASHWNAGSSHFNVAQVLLKNRADVNARDRNGETPLHHLAAEADVEIVQLFLNFKADVNARNYHGEIPLFKAVRSNNLDIVRLLLYHGCDFRTCNFHRSSILHEIAQVNSGDSYLDVCEFILSNGADVNALDEDRNYTPLQYLVNNADFKIVKLFLDHNAYVNVMDFERETPLFNAIRAGKVEVVQLLIDRGSDISSINKYGSTPLHKAAMKNNGQSHLEVAKALLRSGANANAQNHQRKTPLHCLVGKSDIEVVKLFMKFGANPNLKDNDGIVPMNRAIRKRNSEKFIRFMLKYSDVNSINFKENDILKFAGYIWRIILYHVAKIQAMNLPLNPSILNNSSKYIDYFQKCTEELDLAKNSKLKNSWITHFNLLVDSKRKLKNYAGNRQLFKSFKYSNFLKIFPIYGVEMEKNMYKAYQRRKFFDEASIKLSNQLLIFNPNHLIIRDILDCLTSKDFLKICNKSF